MNYKTYPDRLKLLDSYTVPKGRMWKELVRIRAYTPTCPVWNRSDKSLIREWVCHNALYALRIRRSKTKDCDLEYTPKWYMIVLYAVLWALLGPIVKQPVKDIQLWRS